MAWGRRRLGILLVTIVAAGGVLLSSAAADGAGTLVVTTTSDGSDGACTADLCSLRDAVEASNAAGGTVVSVPAGRYTLTLGPLFATAPLELDGAGARVTVIDGNDTEQVVRGDRAARPAIVLSDLTITGGNSQSGDAPDYNEGGGIISWGALTLTRVAVVGNTGQADGGGLNVQGDLTITDSTIANNTAGFSAGGIRAQGGAVSIANTTIAGNTAVERAAIDISLTSHATITNSTIAGNTNASGALDSVNSSSATVTLENDVIANDLTGGTPNCAGTFVSAGHNVATDGSCRLNAEGDLDRAGSVGLGALADNGGGTDTMLPRSGSPLVDAADAAACPAADQRGEARPQGGGCDIGAVETAGPARAGLVQLDAPGDCIAETEIEGCGTPSGAGLAGADWVTASPDGANVYVASSGRPAAVAAFARAADGSLSELGCIAVSGTECASTEAGLGFATSIAVSPDGKNVYVTAADDDTVMIFDRNAVDGTLTPAGCVQDAAARFDRGCATRVHGMVNAYDVAVSPDGKNVYVAAGGGFPELGAVVELARAADGSLSQLASPNDCIEEQGNATPVCGTSTG
ncbi:MAG TPA: choice-of-anchor Q domain-containing protein, partial [Gaiellaceae bacterium]|nr:choice-of-anchor Q domain-containing protein [Gaiellaceae bacterium]